jgi:hypothetical protein
MERLGCQMTHMKWKRQKKIKKKNKEKYHIFKEKYVSLF